MTVTSSLSQARSVAATVKARATRAGLFTAYLVCGLAVFVFGVDYHTRFSTNTSGAYKAGVSVLFLVAVLALRKSERGQAHWPAALAFFAASLTNVVTWYLAGPMQRGLLDLLQVSIDTGPGLAVAKLVDASLRLTPMVAVVWLAGGKLSSLYIKQGNLKWSLGIGLLALANLLATAIAVAASNGRDMTVVFGSLP
jgi:hypothetical protein